MEPRESRASRVRFLIDLAYWTAILAVVCLALKLIGVALPLLLALVMVEAVRPVCRFLSRETRFARNAKGERVLLRRKAPMSRALAGVVSVTALFAALGTLLVLLALRAANVAAELLAALPEFYESRLAPGVDGLYRRLIEWGERFDPSAARTMREWLPSLLSSAGSAVTSASGTAVGWLTSLAAKVPGLLLSATITMIAAVFLSVDYDRIESFLRQNLSPRPLHFLMTARNSFVEMMGRFARSYLLLMLITAAENILGLWLMGVRQPVLIGALIAVVDIFPVVGSGTILIPWAAVSFLTGAPLRGGELMLLYLIITVVRQVLEPRLLGKRVGLRPIVTLGSMVVGGRLFGAVGLFALPVMAAILADLNSSGVLHLFQRSAAPVEKERSIHSEGIEA